MNQPGLTVTCIGDSITEGKPGSSYVDLLRAQLHERMPGCRVINEGRGGDTVAAVLARIRSLDLGSRRGGGHATGNDRRDTAILQVGVNDVFVKVGPQFKLIKIALRQPWARSHDEFAATFRELLDEVCSRFDQVIVVSIGLMGEEAANRFNREIDRLNRLIVDLVADQPRAVYVDALGALRAAIGSASAANQPKQGNTYGTRGPDLGPTDRADRTPRHGRRRPYLPTSATRVLVDYALATEPGRITRISRRRGLTVTLDGVHLNPVGAAIYADLLSTEVERVRE